MDIQSIKQRFGIVGNAQSLNNAISVAQRVAPTDLSILIRGESGVGKEIFSQIIHQLSKRRHNPHIAVNCGAIPEGTIDSELFGHEKGAFTGANEARKGYFEYVDGGTIFLDEVGELPLGTQARLLRILESGEFIRVGSSKVQTTDVRVVAASNIDLEEQIKKNKFREDLYYRLNTVPIYVPPLRERKEDIYLLFRKFAIDFSEKHNTRAVQLDEDARELLKNYHWPGNIRQLKNVAEQVSVLAKDKVVSAEELAEYLPEFKSNTLPALVNDENGESYKHSDMGDREMLYKVLFDLKQDMNDLKRFMFQLTQQKDINEYYETGGDEYTGHEQHYHQEGGGYSRLPELKGREPIVIKQGQQEKEEEASSDQDERSDTLSLAEMEKEMITKALEKHKQKRKAAANELGISERTLYRKIKEYGIAE